jgi:site-specific DNA-methyltransferase (adenine-specific)
MKDILDGSVDLTVTSPPYDNLRAYKGNNALWGEHVWKAAIQDLYRVIKDGGVVVWVVGDATIKGSETGTSFKQALWAKECGFNLHDTMIWEKTSIFAHDPRNRRYKLAFEYMFILSKGKPKTYNEIKDKTVKSAGKRLLGNRGRNPKGEKRKGNSFIANAFQARFNVWKIAGNDGSRNPHPAPFPYQLAHDHIISWSNEGDTVLDCFMGSGTTGVACKNLNRNFIGIEIDESYFALASKRIAETPELQQDMLSFGG